ncbi:phospho-N-acetylmuramoyl-pentapeptide-transferase [Longispora fulva]|uniref:Phospho-N-acetylmuramoyl-pentapeptide-transferase n=1 Tax=Longispora fulva TaxID=619741 RepID=A0A8J7GJE7_9ACTN|nr:phospho-N-acetylmuramoyl-pentapeptide-transferase [Longispora fulva]MBG6137648.1 phospho-N-acetylmuramoyl-pentapeptide-transferase [Longispora fulva]GIG62193.1 phospho-N-acetylmuramoyl-pentapeptide-transferase [Longispora fulva]
MRAVLAAAVVAFVLSLVSTPFAARVLRALKAGQPIRNLGAVTHEGKRGIPTMGGLVFILATVLAYAAGHVVLAGMPAKPLRTAGVTVTGFVLLGLLVCCGLVGFLDDWIKVRRKNPAGLSKRGKLIGQIAAGGVFGWIALSFPSATSGFTVGGDHLSLVRDIDWLYTGKVVAIVLFLVVIMSSSNAVNLTDGLDGLATGASILVLTAYTVIAFWQYRHWCPDYPASRAGEYCYASRDPLEIAMVAAAAAGALLGFLWWNTSPARIIMGDTGALGLGGLIGGLALATRTVLLTPVLGALFVTLTMSVVLQRIWVRTTGRRLFRLSPLHHHFEREGWSEVNIVVRFWIVAGVGVLVALGVFYADFLRAYP